MVKSWTKRNTQRDCWNSGTVRIILLSFSHFKQTFRYDNDKEKIEKSHVAYFDQLSRKVLLIRHKIITEINHTFLQQIEINAQKLAKTLEKLSLPGYVI